jgi:DNA-binding transcriptional LysR family regulator
MSQPSLTRAVGALERATGAALLHRSTRSVTLTPEGARLKAEAERVVRDFDRLVSSGARRTPLRLGFAWVLPDPWAQQAIDLFEEECGVRVEPVRRDDALAGVDCGETDVAVLRGDLETPGLATVPLFQERRIAAVHRRSALAARPALDWSELAEQPLVVNVVSGTTRPDLWPAERRPVAAVRCENFDEWVEAVAADRGVGVVPVSAAHRVAHPAIRFVALHGAPPVAVRVAYPRQGSHPFARVFVRAALRAAIPPHAMAPDGGRAG